MSASSPKAFGTLSAEMRNAAIAAKIARRTAPSSGSTTLVSQAYPTHDHQRTARTSKPRAMPPHVGSAAMSVVHCVSASTKTRSKNSSSGVTRSSSRRTAVRRCVREPTSTGRSSHAGVPAQRRFQDAELARRVRSVRPRADFATRLVLPVALVDLVVLIALGNRYGYHRDELYFRAAGRHPAFGYDAQPALTPLVGRLSAALF